MVARRANDGPLARSDLHPLASETSGQRGLDFSEQAVKKNGGFFLIPKKPSVFSGIPMLFYCLASARVS